MELNKIIKGDSLEVLKTLDSESIDCCITSPPYWGLRDYGVNGQLGLEKTPEEYVNKIVEVFRELKRVLKKEGTLWLNLGDSYIGGGRGGKDQCGKGSMEESRYEQGQKIGLPTGKIEGLKSKDLVGIPWRVSFALQTDGWYLRQDIIWSKPNPMPESVTDRCTKSHEYIFLLSKSPRYYFDLDAIKESAITPFSRGGLSRDERNEPTKKISGENHSGKGFETGEFRNKHSVWKVPTHPFKDAHFATFPEKLIIPMILAGCPEKGMVLDPFIGSGTTAVVAKNLNRNYLGIELNPAYIKIAENRLKQELLL